MTQKTCRSGGPLRRCVTTAIFTAAWITIVQGAERKFNCFYAGPTCRDCLAFDYCAWCTEGVNSSQCVDVTKDILGHEVPMHPADTCTRWVREGTDQCDGDGTEIHSDIIIPEELPEPEPEPAIKHPPQTDDECTWNYGKFRPNWEDVCEYHYKFGDFSLGQSCRLIKHNKTHIIPKKDEECKWQYGRAKCKDEEVCEYRYKFGDMTLGTSCRLKQHRTPTTDGECEWDVGAAKCADPEVCEYRFELGDIDLGQSCRLKGESHPKTDSDCKWDYAHAECGWKSFCEYHYYVGDLTLDQSCVLIGSRDDKGALPKTDEECKWDYKDAHCAFPSVCGWHFQMGDLLLADSCRLKANHKHKYDGPAPIRDGDCNWDYNRGHCEWPDFCGFRYRLGDFSLDASCRIKEADADTPGESTQAPPKTDADCKWEYGETRCAWPEKCFYKMCIGDMDLGASCRLRSDWQYANQTRTCSMDKADEPPKADEDGDHKCVWDYLEGGCKYPSMCKYHYCAMDASLDHSCRLALKDRSCNETEYAAINGEKIPEKDEDCEWDYAGAACMFPSHCHYQYCMGDMHLGESCRLRRDAKKCKTDDDRDRLAKNKEMVLRNRRLEEARIKRLRIEKRASEEKVVWDKVLAMLRKAEDKTKFDGGVAQYEQGLRLVSWAEKAAVLDTRPRWVDAKKVGKEATRVVSALEPLGVIPEQSRKQGVEKICEGKCITYMGDAFYSQCLETCMFSTQHTGR